jgi:TonB family protein
MNKRSMFLLAMIIGSLVVHVLVFGFALRVSTARAKRRVAVAVVGEKKKKEEPKKKEDKPKPKPKMVASARPEASAAPAPVHPTTAPEAAPAAVDTGLTLGNDGPGIDIGGPAVKKPQQATGGGEKRAVQAAPKVKVIAPAGSKDNPEEDNCTEAPSKPVPLTKPTEIEYTQDAKANNVEGRLILRITIGADGAVLDVQVVKSVDPGLDAAAIVAVKTWTFKPAMRCGKAMAGGVFNIARTFELGD